MVTLHQITFIPSSPGIQGAQGIQGIQGDEGNTGAIGPMGGLAFEYNYLNADTANSDPSFGNLKFNNTDLSSANVLYIDDLDVYNQVFDSIIPSLNAVTNVPKGHLTITSKGFRGYYTTFEYTAFQDNTGWWTIAVDYQSGDTNWAAIVAAEGNGIYLSFQPAGDQGIQGTQGIQGNDGFGAQGIQGIQGDQGTQGIQGVQGIQGEGGSEGARQFEVTNNGSSDYVIDGVGGNPDITLLRGFTYRFNVNASGHPFWIKTDPGTGTGDQYNNGVTNNGEDVGIVQFVVPSDAPSTLYYQCQFHGSMVGTINISDTGPAGRSRYPRYSRDSG